MKIAQQSFCLSYGFMQYDFVLEIAYQNNLVYKIHYVQKGKNISLGLLDDFAKKVFCEFAEFFMGKRKIFTFKIALCDEQENIQGTDFQKKVWKELLTIPYGSSISYKELAYRIENPKAVRAVGMACHNNPWSIVVPCHRVIASLGNLQGYAGGIEIKRALLSLEKNIKDIQ